MSKYQTVSADSSKEKTIYFTLRLIGKGGSKKLGAGDHGALDIRPGKLPIAFSIQGGKYYGVDKYENEDEEVALTVANILYMVPLLKRLNVFMGGGIGRIKVEKFKEKDHKVQRSLML